jgi:beta-lactamase regulating signal transducer with metallopeptidase domain
MEENRRKRVETAKQVIAANEKRYTAGLHVSGQQYLTGPEVLDLKCRDILIPDQLVDDAGFTKGKIARLGIPT